MLEIAGDALGRKMDFGGVSFGATYVVEVCVCDEVRVMPRTGSKISRDVVVTVVCDGGGGCCCCDVVSYLDATGDRG